MRSSKSLLIRQIVVMVLLLGLIVVINTPPAIGQSNRLAGETRFETAKIISEALSNTQFNSVILTTGNDFKDALSASVLAFQKKSPILLTNTTPDNSKDAFDYIEKHMTPGGIAYIIGGTGVINKDFEAVLSTKGVAKIIRLGGIDQYSTNISIVKALDAKPNTPVVITSGDNFPDALSISTFAAQNGWPILMVPTNGLTAEMRDYIDILQPASIYITGGFAAVSMKVERELQDIVPKGLIQRFAGLNRFETSAKILKAFAPMPQMIYLTTGYDFPDALAGSVLAAQHGSPLVLIDPNLMELPLPIDQYLADLYDNQVKPKVMALGGSYVVTKWVLREAENILHEGYVSPKLARVRAMRSTNFVNLQDYIPSVIVDSQNSPDNRNAYLRKGTADKLKQVAEIVATKGYRLKIWQAYQPMTSELEIDYHHSRGITVSLTLIDENNHELLMPSGFEDKSIQADRDYDDVSQAQRLNAYYLEEIMVKCGFNPLPHKWWNFNDVDVEMYEVAHELSLTPAIPPLSIDKQTITISAVGDNVLGTDPTFGYASSFTQVFDQNGPNHFFSGVKGIFENDDLTIANLETTLTRATKKLYKGPNGVGYFFKGDPTYTSILKAGSIEAVSVSNNHSMDYLEQGFRDTLQNLKNADVGAFGRGKSFVFEKKGIRTGMLGYIILATDEAERKLIKEQIKTQISELRKTCQIIVVSFHWGIENEYKPIDLQRDFGHYAIDSGADLVIGHHPHVLQPIENYKERYILYSLGNFSFGGNANPWEKDTAIVQQSFHFANGELWNVSTPQVIPCSLSSTSWRNDYRPCTVQGEAAARVLKNLNWP